MEALCPVFKQKVGMFLRVSFGAPQGTGAHGRRLQRAWLVTMRHEHRQNVFLGHGLRALVYCWNCLAEQSGWGGMRARLIHFVARQKSGGGWSIRASIGVYCLEE